MLIVISPAKKIGFSPVSIASQRSCSISRFLKETQHLVDVLREYSVSQLSELMGLSEKLAVLNVERMQKWKAPQRIEEDCQQALSVFQGAVYKAMKVEDWGVEDWNEAQKGLRILSGLYGLLRPIDLIRAYRLEMGTSLKVGGGVKNLYQFWGKSLSRQVEKDREESGSSCVINLASKEYFNALPELRVPVITPVFKDFKGGSYKVVGVMAKQARGWMSRFIIQNRLKEMVDLKSFEQGGYQFSRQESDKKTLVFLRKS